MIDQNDMNVKRFAHVLSLCLDGAKGGRVDAAGARESLEHSTVRSESQALLHAL